MTQGIHPLAANMVNQLNRVDVISNNLANANTPGFKQDKLVEGSFNHYLQKTKEENEVPMELSTVMNTIPKIDGKYMEQTLGSTVQTGNGLDFALSEKNMFFKVQNTDANEIQLTRDGTFKVLNNQLVTQNGYQVLDNNNQPIQVDEENQFALNIGVVRSDFSNLDKIGNNNYTVKDQNAVQNVQDSGQFVLQGAYEQSNVSSIHAMVALIEAQRKFEQAQKAVTGIDQINSKVIESIGNNR
jgi:flagellar basal-body rod protein FlgG